MWTLLDGNREISRPGRKERISGRRRASEGAEIDYEHAAVCAVMTPLSQALSSISRGAGRKLRTTQLLTIQSVTIGALAKAMVEARSLPWGRPTPQKRTA